MRYIEIGRWHLQLLGPSWGHWTIGFWYLYDEFDDADCLTVSIGPFGIGIGRYRFTEMEREDEDPSD